MFSVSKAFRPNLLSSRRSVAPDDSNISAYQSAGDTHILPFCLPFLNVVLMFAIGRRRNKLISPASFNYQSIFCSQFLLLPLLLPLLVSLWLRLLLSRGNWKFNASSSCSRIDFRSWTFLSLTSRKAWIILSSV